MTATLDCCGMKCPQPVLKAKKALKDVEVGEALEVLTDDPHAIEDLKVFCTQCGHTVVSQETDEQGKTRHMIRKEH